MSVYISPSLYIYVYTQTYIYIYIHIYIYDSCEDFTRLAETRLSQNSLSYPNIAKVMLSYLEPS